MKSKIIYIRGKFIGKNKELKEIYLYAKNIMKVYGLIPNFIGVDAEEGWYGNKILSIQRKEKQLLKDLDENKKIIGIELYSHEMQDKEFIMEKSFFWINKNYGIISFEIDEKCINEVNFKEILEEFRKYIIPKIEEFFLWDAREIPLKYIKNGEEVLNEDQKVTSIYKKIY